MVKGTSSGGCECTYNLHHNRGIHFSPLAHGSRLISRADPSLERCLLKAPGSHSLVPVPTDSPPERGKR